MLAREPIIAAVLPDSIGGSGLHVPDSQRPFPVRRTVPLSFRAGVSDGQETGVEPYRLSNTSVSSPAAPLTCTPVLCTLAFCRPPIQRDGRGQAPCHPSSDQNPKCWHRSPSRTSYPCSKSSSLRPYRRGSIVRAPPPLAGRAFSPWLFCFQRVCGRKRRP